MTWTSRTHSGLSGGSLWISDATASSGVVAQDVIAQIDPNTGKRRTIEMPYDTLFLAWLDGSGDLWASHFAQGVTRLHAATSAMETVDIGLVSPGQMAVAGDAVWVADGEAPEVARVQAIGAPRSRVIRLGLLGGDVDFIAAGEGAIWATQTQGRRLWRIDPDSNKKTPIDVSVSADGRRSGNGRRLGSGPGLI